MTRPIDENDFRKYLTPFADGELEVEQSLRVLEHMAMYPQAAKRVMHQQQLRQSIGRHLIAHTPAAPESLRDRLEAAMPPLAKTSRTVPFQWRRVISLGVAAMVILAIGVWMGRTVAPPVTGLSPVTAAAPTTPIPTFLITMAVRMHVACSRFSSHSHDAGFPMETAALGNAMTSYLGKSMSVPSFADLGYEFIGAQPCPLPGAAKTVHLLYRAKGPTVRDTISLFVQPDKGQANLIPEHGYNSSGTHSPHPAMVWRKSGLVYFLVGDAQEPVNSAAKLTGAPI